MSGIGRGGNQAELSRERDITREEAARARRQIRREDVEAGGRVRRDDGIEASIGNGAFGNRGARRPGVDDGQSVIGRAGDKAGLTDGGVAADQEPEIALGVLVLERAAPVGVVVRDAHGVEAANADAVAVARRFGEAQDDRALLGMHHEVVDGSDHDLRDAADHRHGAGKAGKILAGNGRAIGIDRVILETEMDFNRRAQRSQRMKNLEGKRRMIHGHSAGD
jgi:hypothetical protein